MHPRPLTFGQVKYTNPQVDFAIFLDDSSHFIENHFRPYTMIESGGAEALVKDF